MYAQAAIKPNTLLRNGAYGIVMRDVQKCTCAGASLRGRNSAPLCCIKLDTATDCACGSGGMFVQSGDFVNAAGMNANSAMTFYGQEKVEYNAQLCLMNMAVHGLTGVIKSGDEANTFYHDAHNLDGCCDYIMANPPFNVDKVKAESCESAGRLPFGMPAVNKNKEVGNANYLWISYFYSYLNEHGRAGFVMASSATDSQKKDKDIREQLIKTGNVDVMISVGNNFFYTKSLPCSLWFFDKAKSEAIRDKVLFIDARNYYTVVDRTLNEWSDWQLKNLNAIVWLYRGEKDKYKELLQTYRNSIETAIIQVQSAAEIFVQKMDSEHLETIRVAADKVKFQGEFASLTETKDTLSQLKKTVRSTVKSIIDYYSSMTKSQFKVLQEQFQQKNGFSLDVLSRYKSVLTAAEDVAVYLIDDVIQTIKDARWLYEKFGEGEYQDIAGLCKVADISEIEEKGWSLTPGAYVGVAPVQDDGVDFAERMAEIHRELLSLQAESNDLMDTISQNMKEMGI